MPTVTTGFSAHLFKADIVRTVGLRAHLENAWKERECNAALTAWIRGGTLNTLTTSFDVKLFKAQSKSAALTGNLQAEQSADADLSAILVAQTALTTAFSAHLADTLAKFTNLRAILGLGTQSTTASLSARLVDVQELRTVPSAWLANRKTGAVSTSAYLRPTLGQLSHLSAYLRIEDRTSSASLSAWLSPTYGQIASVTGYLRNESTTKTTSLSGWVAARRNGPAESVKLGALLLGNEAKTAATTRGRRV